MADALLLFAVNEGDIQQVSTLIFEARANVNTVNSVGATPCHVCQNTFFIQ